MIICMGKGSFVLVENSFYW